MSLRALWVLLIDRFTLPFFKKAPRKGWVVFALLAMASSFFAISCIDPVQNPWYFAGGLAILSCFTGCLYMAGISYEIESLEDDSYALGSANVIAGYRLGLLCAGAGALFLASFWDFPITLRILSLLFLLAAGIIFSLKEPIKSPLLQYQNPPSAKELWKKTFITPITSFFARSSWLQTLLFLLFFKLGDEMAKSMEGPFYLSLGFTKMELAGAAKTWGMLATLMGAYCGGIFLKTRHLFAVSALHATSLYCYFFMAWVGKSLPALYVTVAFEHFTGGLLMTAFIAFLWKQCDKPYAAIQYCLYWSLISFKTDLISCLGGFLASALASWKLFFLSVACIGSCTAILPFILQELFYGRSVQKGNLHPDSSKVL